MGKRMLTSSEGARGARTRDHYTQESVSLYKIVGGIPVQTTASTTRGDAHERGLLHAVARLTVSCVFDGKLSLVYKQYPATNRRSGNKLCEPAGGHLASNETHVASIEREVREELFAHLTCPDQQLPIKMQDVGHFVELGRNVSGEIKPIHVVFQYYAHIDQDPFRLFQFDPKETRALTVIPAWRALLHFLNPNITGLYSSRYFENDKLTAGDIRVDGKRFRVKDQHGYHGPATVNLAVRAYAGRPIDNPSGNFLEEFGVRNEPAMRQLLAELRRIDSQLNRSEIKL